jgi:hypothetical protein
MTRTQLATRSAFTVLVLVLASGCSTTKLAVRSMEPILEESVAVGQSYADIELVEDGMPANLVLLDGLIRTDPRPKLLVLGARLYFSYAFAFVEDEDPDRAASLYARARDYGRERLGRDGSLKRALASGRAADVREALADLDEDDAPALLWTAAAWAGWANLSLEDPEAVADLPVIEALLDRAVALDERFLFGMPHLLLGAFHAARPPLLGGDAERAHEHFARAAAVGEGKLLLVPVYEARYVAHAQLDRDLFDRLLAGALKASLDAAPEIRLLNAVAQRKARALQAVGDDLF